MTNKTISLRFRIVWLIAILLVVISMLTGNLLSLVLATSGTLLAIIAGIMEAIHG